MEVKDQGGCGSGLDRCRDDGMDERVELLLGLRDESEELFLSLVELGGLVDALNVGFKGRELLEVVVGGEDTADVDNGSVE